MLLAIGVAGCGPAHAPVSSPPPAPEIDAAIVDAAGAPADAAAPVDAPLPDAATTEAARCPAGHDRRDLAAVLPERFTVPAAGDVCDLDDRVIVVDDRAVTVVTRPRLTRTRAPIQHRERLRDRCGGPGGGHLGCSLAYRRVRSAVLGNLTMEFGNNQGNVLYDERQPSSGQACREVPQDVIATCSTATRFVTVGYREVPASSRTCWQLRAAVWEGAQPTELAAELDGAASDADHWVVRLPARDMTLRFDRHAAVLEIGATRERCVASRLAP